MLFYCTADLDCNVVKVKSLSHLVQTENQSDIHSPVASGRSLGLPPSETLIPMKKSCNNIALSISVCIPKTSLESSVLIAHSMSHTPCLAASLRNQTRHFTYSVVLQF